MSSYLMYIVFLIMCLLTGETLNIKDAYNHPKFYPEVDKTTGFKTRYEQRERRRRRRRKIREKDSLLQGMNEVLVKCLIVFHYRNVLCIPISTDKGSKSNMHTCTHAHTRTHTHTHTHTCSYVAWNTFFAFC